MAEADTETTELHAIMPHLAYNSADLDDKYPPMGMAQDISEDNEEQWSTWDGIAKRGDDIIREVMARMTREGRKRCEVSTTTNNRTTPTTTTATTTTNTTMPVARRDNDAMGYVAGGDVV